MELPNELGVCWVYDMVLIHKKYMCITIYSTFNTF